MVAAGAVGVVGAVLLAGCGPSDQDLRRDRLAAAVDATFAEPVAFNLTIDASDEALRDFGAAAGPLAGLLAGSSAAGVVEGDRVAFGLTVGGLDLLQVRVIGAGEQYLRFNLGGLAQLATGSSEAVRDQLEAGMADAGLDPEARDAVLAAAGGEWVRLVADPVDGPSAGASVGEALAALVRTAEPVDHLGSLDDEPFDGQLDVEVDVERALAAVAEALAGLVPTAPSTAPTTAPTTEAAQVLDARVVVSAGTVRSMVVELGPLAEGGQDLDLVLDLRQLAPDGDLVRPPDAVATVTLDQLRRAAAALRPLGS